MEFKQYAAGKRMGIKVNIIILRIQNQMPIFLQRYQGNFRGQWKLFSVVHTKIITHP